MAAAPVLSRSFVDLSRNPLAGRRPLNEVVFDQDKQCFKARVQSADGQGTEWIPARGLRPLLTECFWPDYNYEDAEAVAKRAALGAVQRKPTSTGGSARAGMERGKYVHGQLEDWVRLKPETFAEVHPIVHPFTADALNAIHNDMHLTLVAAEVPVMCGTGWFATAADLLAVDQQDRLIVLELKTGMSNYSAHANRMMRGRALSRICDNSPMQQAYVQLLITAMMLSKQYHKPVHASYVIHVTEEGVRRCGMPVELVRRREAVYREVCKRAIRDRLRTRRSSKKGTHSRR